MSKTLQNIPAQSTVMLDANVVIYALFPQVAYHEACKELLARGARSELQLRLTNDSLILAVMKREQIHYLATNDTDFERLPGIAVRRPA